MLGRAKPNREYGGAALFLYPEFVGLPSEMIPTNNYELKSNQIIYSKMKQKNLSITFFILTLLTCQSGFAYDFEVNGIYYGLNSSTMTAYVTGKTWEGGGYSGDIVIPSKVTYNTKELDVTTIGKKAFYGCDITSISIPNSVTSIEESSFQGCKITAHSDFSVADLHRPCMTA